MKFSEILGFMELIFEVKIFAFSNSFIFWEDILRRENNLLLQYHVAFVQNLHLPKNLV